MFLFREKIGFMLLNDTLKTVSQASGLYLMQTLLVMKAIGIIQEAKFQLFSLVFMLLNLLDI